MANLIGCQQFKNTLSNIIQSVTKQNDKNPTLDVVQMQWQSSVIGITTVTLCNLYNDCYCNRGNIWNCYTIYFAKLLCVAMHSFKLILKLYISISVQQKKYLFFPNVSTFIKYFSKFLYQLSYTNSYKFINYFHTLNRIVFCTEVFAFVLC